jgi:hypothetical protein
VAASSAATITPSAIHAASRCRRLAAGGDGRGGVWESLGSDAGPEGIDANAASGEGA